MHHFEVRWTLDDAENYFFRPTYNEKIRKLSAENWMQLTFLVPSRNHHQDAMHGLLGKRSATLAHWKTWVFKKFPPKTRRRKTYLQQKLRPGPITTLPKQISKNQTDPTNTFEENEHQIWKTQWARGNVNNFEKTFRFSWRKLGGKKLAENITARHST